MGLIRSLLLGLALLCFLVLALVANVGLWSLTTFVDSKAFATTTARILEQPQVRGLLAERLAARLADLVAPSTGKVPTQVRRALGVAAGATQADIRAVFARMIETTLGDPSMVAIEETALEDLHRALLALIADGPHEGASLTLDLNDVIAALHARLDPAGSGFLGHAMPPDLGTLTLVEADGLGLLAGSLQLLEALRWLLVAMCLAAALLVLLLARVRLHAVAWLGLALVLVGTACLLAASGAPLLASRLFASRPDTLGSLEATLDGLTAGLITQSAVLAGLGLAMLVVGITAGMVSGRDDGTNRTDGYG